MAYVKRKRTRSLRRRRPVRRRRSFKKRRFSRKKYPVYRKPKSDHYNACFDWDRDLVTTHTISSGNIGSGAVSGGHIQFSLSQFTKLMSWYDKFERVRINMITIAFRPVRCETVTTDAQISGSAVNANFKIPLIWHRPDYNTPHPPDFSGTYDDIIERFEGRPGLRKHPMTRGFKYTFRPRLLDAQLSHMLGGEAQMMYKPGKARPWMELANTGFLQSELYPVIQYLHENVTPDGGWRLEPSCKVYVTFAGRRN